MVRYVVAYEVCEGASIEPDVPKGRRIDVLLCITGGVIMVWMQRDFIIDTVYYKDSVVLVAMFYPMA